MVELGSENFLGNGDTACPGARSDPKTLHEGGARGKERAGRRQEEHCRSAEQDKLPGVHMAPHATHVFFPALQTSKGTDRPTDGF